MLAIGTVPPRCRYAFSVNHAIRAMRCARAQHTTSCAFDTSASDKKVYVSFAKDKACP